MTTSGEAMPYYWFIWDGVNEAHIAEHGVTTAEVEEVICDPEFTDRSGSSGRPVAEGWTRSGKYLVCVYEYLDADTIYPVTAYEVGA